MKKIATLLFLSLLISCSQQPEVRIIELPTEATEATPDGAWRQDFERTKDPALGYPTPERLIPVLARIKNQRLMEAVPGTSTDPWINRGPYDIGGRTRAIMFDPNDTDNKKVWAGGVTGGLWVNNDITSSGSEWTAVDDFWDNIAITCMAYDPNDNNTFYVGTGEGWGQSVSGARGAGIWKTTDGGASWSQLGSTSGFYFVNDIVVRDESGSSVVYAGVERFGYEGDFHGLDFGLQRSTNGGTSWSQVMPSSGFRPYSPADIELDANNNLWVGTVDNSLGQGGGIILTSSDGTTWTVSDSIIDGDRVELACAPSDANYVYALIESGGVVSTIKRTTNGGTSWSAVTEPADTDTDIPNTDFSRGQAWYDLIACVNPSDENDVIVGGISLFRTTDGGTNWSQISKWSNNNNMAALTCSEVHADQHQIVYRPGSSTEVVIGNDGGVFYCSAIGSAASSNVIQPRNNGYNVTQFYAAAMHPTAGENYYLAGSQDNGTQLFNKFGLGSTVEATGGDGGFCHIDSTDGNTQITATTRNNFFISTDGGGSFGSLASFSGGEFINPTDYDDINDLLYSGFSSTVIARTTTAGAATGISVTLGDVASHFRVSPYSTTDTSNIFIGTESGSLFRMDSANSASPFVTNITGGSFPSGAISCVEVGGSDDTLVVTFFNYGVTSIWYTTNGGSSWVSKEGDLPDMPVRWFLFNPNDRTEAIVATELGVWATTNFDDASPSWTASTSGLANVRVDMLQWRASDNQVVAATHGRGLFSCDAFSNQAPVADFGTTTEQAGTQMEVLFSDQSTGNPTSWSWSFSPATVNFLDGTDANSQNPVVQFTETGTYQVELTATNDEGSDTETKASFISVLSATAVPYTQNFDGFTTCTPSNACNLSCTLSSDWLNASSSSDNSDWITRTGTTPSSDTGPTTDNTSGSGNYLYTEASSCNDREMILYSPVFDLRSAQNPSLSFATHLYGTYMGTLELAVYNNGQWEVIWESFGNIGNSWTTQSAIDLSAYTGSDILFRFKGTTGSSFTSDMAIDDFAISENIIRWDNGGATTNWSDADNWSNDEVPGSDAYVTLDNTFVAGSYTINLASSQQVAGIDIEMGSNTVTLSGGNALNVTGVVNPTNGTMASAGQLTLKAISELEYGQIAAGSGSIGGNVINEWYYNGRSGYRHISSPVSCNLSEITADFSRLVFSSGSNGSIWNWDPTISDWDHPASGSDAFDEAISVFMGTSSNTEFSPLPFNFDATGTLTVGNQSQTLTYSTGNPADFVDPGENSGWNFLFNPYPSILDWEEVTGDVGFPAELSTTVYFWDESLDSDGSYASYNATTNTSVKGGGQEIPKGQAVWIQLSSSPGGGSTTLNLTDDMRSTSSSPKPKTASTLLSKVAITARQGGKQDLLRFAHFEGATPIYDHRYDHLEMDNGLYTLSLRSTAGPRNLAYNCMEYYAYPIPFSLHSPSGKEVELSFEIDQNFVGDEPLYVKNLETGEVHELSDGEYRFVPTTPGEEVPLLLMHEPDDDLSSRPEVQIGSGPGYLQLFLRDYGSFDEIYVFDLSGKMVIHENLNAASREQRVEIHRNGAFLVHLKSANGNSYSEKVVVME